MRAWVKSPVNKSPSAFSVPLRGEDHPRRSQGIASLFREKIISPRQALKLASLTLFETAQYFNIFIVPIHYYVPLASTRHLRKTRDRWNRPADLMTLPLNLDRMRQVLTESIAPFEPEYRGNAVFLEGVKNQAGPGFGYIEAQAMHAFLRKTRPKRVIEVGSGVSTWCMLAALKANEKDGFGGFELACIEPNPSQFLLSLPVHLEREGVEEIDLAFFDQLESNDVLSIDSSHVARCCGDVARIYLEILPRLKPGVFVHIHDITFPYLFPRDVEQTYTQSMETALLFAMLTHSVRFEVLICLSLIHYADQSLMKRVFPEYDPQPNIGGLPGVGVRQFGEKRHFPSSTYLIVK
jgi:predicted O-methyltransferase YrrM